MSRTLRTAILAGWAMSAAVLAQEAAPAVPATPKVETDPKAAGGYILGAEDQLQVWARDADEISARPYRIDHTGSINLPLVGRIEAAGMTVQDLEFDLELRLRKFIKEPEVTVSVTEFRSSAAFVFGAVRTPGLVQLLGPKTLLEILSLAGGLNPDASNTVILTRRSEYGKIPLASAQTENSEEYSVAEIDVKSLIDGRRPEENLVIRPFDVITVPRSDVVYVTGEVRSPGSFQPKEQPLTVLQVVSMAGGVTPAAVAQNAKIMRPIMGGPKRYDIPLDVKQIIAGRATDFPLQPGDILFIPSQSLTKNRVVTRITEAVINYGAQIALWSILWRGR
ncbi:MAG: SLBB domain-containing protein [Bryobacterales bacterium]|nr:SLBB domain-containing protein [Bryobacterales bacterium]